MGSQGGRRPSWVLTCAPGNPLHSGGLPFYVLHMGIPHKVFLEQLSLNFIKKFKNALERSAHLSPMFLSSDSPRMTL